MMLWLLDIIIAAALLVASDLSYRAGRARRDRTDDSLRAQLTTVQASTLGLLALILGFTLAMAESRFDVRRQTVIAESAAVASAYRRAEILPEPERAQSRELLRAYVDARRAYFRASPDDVAATTRHAQELHVGLWTRAVTVARAHPDWDVVVAYVEVLDDVIRLEAARDLVITSRLPWTIRLLLLLVALVAVAVTGYATGLAGARSPISLYVLPILIALACMVVLDLDRTRAGAITTGDAGMERLQRTMAAERTQAGR